MTTNWRHKAACQGEDPELFFPIGKGESAGAQLQAAEAKAVCARCPVREACLAWALDTNVEYGVLGGTDENERRAVLRQSRRVSVAS